MDSPKYEGFMLLGGGPPRETENAATDQNQLGLVAVW